MGEQIHWRFYGYTTPAEGRTVQDWFDGLTDEERDDALDNLGFLQKQPRHLWKLPRFEAFDSEISEVRFRANTTKKTYRIYGTFWPDGKRYSYTFLLGKSKTRSNDSLGKKAAVNRLKLLKRGEGNVHEFKF